MPLVNKWGETPDEAEYNDNWQRALAAERALKAWHAEIDKKKKGGGK